MSDPQQSRFLHDGNELITYTWPAPGRPRVYLIHGIGMGYRVYDRLIAGLRAASRTAEGPAFEVSAVDLPGFGDCPEPQKAQSIAHTADLVALSIAETSPGAPYIVIGHSMGAQVAAELAARHPACVERLVLVGTTVNPEERTAWRQACRMVQDLGNARPTVLAKGVLAYARTGPKWFIEKLAPTLAHRIEETLPRITQPTLVLRGENDPVSSRAWSRRVATVLPQAHYAELSGRGHESIIAEPDTAIEEMLAWLGSG